MEMKKTKADWIQIGGSADYPSDEGVFAPVPEDDWPDEVKIVRILNEYAQGGEDVYRVTTSHIACRDVKGANGERIREKAGISREDWEMMNCHNRAYVAEDVLDEGSTYEEGNLGEVFRESFGRDARVENINGKVATSRDWNDMWADSED